MTENHQTAGPSEPDSQDPLLVVVSGPGGVGKSTVVSILIDRHPDLWLSRSWTTRQQRLGESDDAYVFVTRQEFEARLAEGGFLEHAEFLGNYYGTPTLADSDGRDVLLEIDVQGARQVIEREPGSLLLFLQAPSEDEQLARLRRRGDPEHKVAERVAKAAEEADAGKELEAHIITNYDIDDTVEQMYLAVERARTGRLKSL